jgi:hypothetical protein
MCRLLFNSLDERHLQDISALGEGPVAVDSEGDAVDLHDTNSAFMRVHINDLTLAGIGKMSLCFRKMMARDLGKPGRMDYLYLPMHAFPSKQYPLRFDIVSLSF